MIITWLYNKAKSRNAGQGKTPPPPRACVHQPEPSTAICLECKAQKSIVRKYRWKIILGLVFPYALQALDSTM
jgi:hypothetical protein